MENDYDVVSLKREELDSKYVINSMQYVQESKLIDRTKDICTPSRRCEPLHSKQHKAPIASPPSISGGGTINDAHRGCRSLQSEQI
jgi:hypothetical protein